MFLDSLNLVRGRETEMNINETEKQPVALILSLLKNF